MLDRSNVIRRCLRPLCTVVCSFAPFAFAAENANDATPIEEVVITGTRMATAAENLPSSLTVLDTDDITTRGSASVIDLLRGVEGVHVSQPGGRSTFDYNHALTEES